MKNSKINLIMLATMLAMQAITYTKDEERTWGQFLDQHKYKIGAGIAIAGVGTAAMLYSDEFMKLFNSMSPAEQEQVKNQVEQSINNDEQQIQEKLAVVEENIAELANATEGKKHSGAQEKTTAQKEAVAAQKLQEIAQLEQQVEQKQSWWSASWKHFTGQGTGYNSENPNDASSDDFRSDEERAQQRKREQHTIDSLTLGPEKAELRKRKKILDEQSVNMQKKENEYSKKAQELLQEQLDNGSLPWENLKQALQDSSSEAMDKLKKENPDYVQYEKDSSKYYKDERAAVEKELNVRYPNKEDNEVEPGFNTIVSYGNPINYWRAYQEKQEIKTAQED